jgi:hypothetical protein
MAVVRVMVGSVVAGVLLAVAVVAGGAALEASRDAGGGADDPAALGTAIPAGVVDSLQDERNFASSSMIGVEDAVALPVDTFAEATGRTDDALRAFRTEVGRAGGRTAGAFGPELDRIDGRIDALRAEVDGLTGPRGLNGEVDKAQSLFEDYTSLIDDLLAADDDVVAGIDDPTVRRGAALMDLAHRQDTVVGLLTRELLIAAISPGGNGLVDTPDEVSSVAAHLARWRQDDRKIDQLATGVFRPAADRLLARPEIGELQGSIDQSIRTGQISVANQDPFLRALASDHDAAYTTFRRDVAAVLEAQGDQRSVDATTDRNRAVLVTVAALALALVVTAVVVLPALAGPRRKAPRGKVDHLV